MATIEAGLIKSVIIEADIERDRKTCINLDLKVTGANRDLAQWIVDHPRYSQRTVAGWLGCDHARIFYLKKWAMNGFHGLPSGKGNKTDNRVGGHGGARHQETLESLDNSEMADPATIEDNALHSLSRMCEHARVFKKFFKSSALDREAEVRIIAAIDRMILRWRSAQKTLTRKGHFNGQA